MKVIAGRHRGAKLLTRTDHSIRPTTQRIKEWIFQVIEPYLADSYFLDLFSGSGNLGIEALSRGSKFVAFIDNCTGPLIRRNLNAVKPEAKTKIYRDDVVRFLRRRHPARFRFSIIIADPPYEYNSYSNLFSALYFSEILKPEGLFILESGKHSQLEIPEVFYPVIREKTFGETKITLFQKGTT